MKLSEKHQSTSRGAIFLIVSIVAVSGLGGCERKEKVVEIQVPGFNLEVNKTTSPTGDKGVEIKSQGDKKIEIDATNKKTTSDY
ncbi:MAG: hypothetical protein JWN70_2834 [Planctomycetaceae bacterium]|nr:hypothetical protein [Planctomycetaceae bacterium]